MLTLLSAHTGVTTQATSMSPLCPATLVPPVLLRPSTRESLWKRRRKSSDLILAQPGGKKRDTLWQQDVSCRITGEWKGNVELLRQEAWSERWKQGRKTRSGADLGGRTGGELERKSWLEGEI